MTGGGFGVDNAAAMGLCGSGRLVVRGDGEPQWLVVRTKARRERIAERHLAQRGVETYCPLFAEPAWHRRAPKGPVPLFASYLFVHCDPGRTLSAIRYCPGVLDLVTFDQKLARVEDEVIEALRAREGGRGYILPAEVERGIAQGRRVRVMAGPLRGLEGVFHGYLRGKQRAWVLLEFLRTRSLVEVEAAALAVAGC